MKKITFLILVMILGMSSVSFGRSYLCDSTQGVLLSFITDEVTDHTTSEKFRFVVKTGENNSKIKSVKYFGKDWVVCDERNSRVKLSSSGEIIICRELHETKYGGYTKVEFSLDKREKKFNYYYFYIGSDSGYNMREGKVFTGKCEEI